MFIFIHSFYWDCDMAPWVSWVATSDLLSIPFVLHHSDVIMGAMAFQITGLTTVYSTVYWGANKKKSKLHVTGVLVTSLYTTITPDRESYAFVVISLWQTYILAFCTGNLLVSRRFPSQMVSCCGVSIFSLSFAAEDTANLSMIWDAMTLKGLTVMKYTLNIMLNEYFSKHFKKQSSNTSVQWAHFHTSIKCIQWF